MRPPSPAGRFATVFVTGAGTLALEIVSIRQMAPAFGASIFIWGAVLSVTLVCLAAGYRWGGVLGDRLADPDGRLLRHVLVAAAWVGALPLWAAVLLRIGLRAGSYAGPLLVSVGLFAAPMTLLATVVPLAFRGALGEDRSRPGGKVGDLFAVSTAGSVAGALLTAYLAIPLLGVSRSFFVVAACLFAAALPELFRGEEMVLGILILVVLTGGRLLPLLPSAALREGVRFLDRRASRYAQLDVIGDVRDGSRVLLLDGASQNWLSGPDWLRSGFRYIEAVAAQPARYGVSPGRAVVFGLGAGALPRLLARDGWSVEVVEIDPAVRETAVRWFRFPEDGIPVHLEDARTWLADRREGDRPYDLMVLDVTGGGDPATHLYTLQALRLMEHALAPRGLLAVNLVAFTRPPADRVLRHFEATVARVFPNVEVVDLDPPATRRGDLSQVLVLASRREAAVGRSAGGFRTLPVARAAAPLTDDWNPLPLWAAPVARAWRRNVRQWLGEAALIPE